MIVEVLDTTALLGIWDHDSGNSSGPYSVL